MEFGPPKPANVSFSHVPRALLHALFTPGGPFAARRRLQLGLVLLPTAGLPLRQLGQQPRVQPLHQFGAVLPGQRQPHSRAAWRTQACAPARERKRYGGRERGRGERQRKEEMRGGERGMGVGEGAGAVKGFGYQSLHPCHRKEIKKIYIYPPNLQLSSKG